MKRKLLNLGLLGVVFSCGASGGSDLGGATDIPYTKPGQVVTTLGGVQVGGTFVDVGASATLVSSKDGIATFKVVADLTQNVTLKKFNDLIPASAKDSSGKINTEVKFKLTSEGIADHFNKDGKPHTLVKYGAAVGDTFALTKSDGVTITRKVTAKSTTDDFSWGFLNIKTVTVEQDSRIPGIKKFVFQANHKFGLVSVQVVADDGSTLTTALSPKLY